MKQKGTNNIGLKNMIEGRPIKLILAFAFPMLIGNILQQFYNMVDSIVVGNYVGKGALAAVGAGFPIIFMMVSMFIGLGLGSTILISQFFGAGDLENVKKTAQTIYTAVIISIIPISVIGVILCEPLLKLINTPADILPLSKTYMVIIFGGMIGAVGYNINTGILQGLGDSKSSLLFLAIATIINIVLDLAFVIIFELGVAGVAYATIIAQGFSWIFGIIYIRRKHEFFNFSIFKFVFDKNLFKKILKLGLPTGIQQSLFSIGIISLQSLVNSYGSDFIAGFNAANIIDMFAFMPIQSFSTAVTTFVGQNIGAKRMDRVHEGTVQTIIVSIVLSIIFAFILIPLGPYLLGLFNKDINVIESGMVYLNNVMPFYFLLSIVFILNSVIRGAGESVIPMIGSIVSLWLGRIPSSFLIAKYFGRNYIFISYGVGWLLWSMFAIPYYLSGKWKNKNLIHDIDIKE